MVRVNDISWKLIGSKDYLSPATPAGVYLVRNNRWYRDDRLEVPEQILNELYKKLMATLARKLQARSGYPGNTPQLQGLAQSSTATLSAAQNHLKAQLDLETEILEKLSPWQIANGLKWSAFPLASSDSNFSVANIGKQNDDSWSSNWYPFQDIADVIVRQPGTLRFYGSLDANKRQALIEGHLRYTDLTDWQRSHLHTIAPIIAVALNRNVDRELHIGIRNQPSPRMRLGISKLGDIEFAEFVSFYVSDASDSNQPMNEQK